MGKTNEEIFEMGRSSRLGQLMWELAEREAAKDDAAQVEREDIAALIAATESWSDVLTLTNRLAEIAHAEINRRNSSKTAERLVESWRKDTGINPIELYRESLWCEREASGRRMGNLARHSAILRLRPDLDANLGTREADAARAELERISLKLKNLVRAPGALADIFETIRDTMPDLAPARGEAA